MFPFIRIVLFIFPAVVLFAILLPSYFSLKWRGQRIQSIIVKGLCTLVTVIFCFNGCLINPKVAFWLILAGLIFCLIGDIAIEKNLYAGVVGFLVAHGLFIIAFLLIAPPKLLFIPVYIIILSSIVFYFRKQFCRLGIHIIPFLIYGMVICAMLVLALTLPFSTSNTILAVGAILFTLSDILLARNTLIAIEKGSLPRRNEVISLTCYYAALYLIALSVWL